MRVTATDRRQVKVERPDRVTTTIAQQCMLVKD